MTRAMNRLSAGQFASGALASNHWVTLEVRGRSSGRTITFPLVAVTSGGERYLASMLGDVANSVATVRAAHGTAVLRHGRREPDHLVKVEVTDRAPILRDYLAAAPGTRAHLPVVADAPLAAFERIATSNPVLRIDPAGT